MRRRGFRRNGALGIRLGHGGKGCDPGFRSQRPRRRVGHQDDRPRLIGGDPCEQAQRDRARGRLAPSRSDQDDALRGRGTNPPHYGGDLVIRLEVEQL